VQSSSSSSDQWLVSQWARQGKTVTGPTYGNMQVRVPSAQFDAAKKAITAAAAAIGGKVTSESESVQDVTASYVDTVARQKTAKAALKRMETLLAAAQNVHEVMSVQREMDAITERIESATAVRKGLETRATMSTLNLNFNMPPPPAPTPQPLPGWSASLTLSDAVAALGKAGQGAVDVLIYTAVFAVPVSLLLVVAVTALRKVVGRLHAADGSREASSGGYAPMR
jgi:hypothetical protein